MTIDTEPYSQAVQEFRSRKDAYFKAGQGPLDPAVLPDFAGLSYYAPDPSWAFTVPLETLPQDASAEFILQTNTGETRTMARYGRVRVPFPGGEHSLSVFTPLGEEAPARIFIPFRDATSGQETYGAGRYLDVPVDRDADGGPLVSVDFNMAYHPYCAYGDGWTCPLPPRENVLMQAVRAGERLPTPAT